MSSQSPSVDPESHHDSEMKKPKSASLKASSLLRRKRSNVATSTEILAKMDKVIFPDNKWILKWDLVVITALFLLMFILPYQIGVSGGFGLLTSIPWLVFNVFLNAIFFVDTFLYFFRAYHTADGKLVLNLKKIRKTYLKTYFIPNFLSVLPFTIAFYFAGTTYLDDPDDPSASSTNLLSIIKFAEILKLIRLVRVKSILESSEVITRFRLRRNSQVLELCKYVFLIIVASHWFACVWCFVAFIEANGFDSEALLETPNWIGYWFENNNVDGGLNPIGWDQATERYALSLFWAIQTITSIGYGNIVPVTVAEWYVACVLQLCAGVIWAYVIGGLVGVTAGMQVREENFRTRTDQANDLIHQFSSPAEVSGQDEFLDCKEVAHQIRSFIYYQHKLSKITQCSSNIVQSFPVFETLTPELQRKSSVLLMRPYLKAVPYLSAQYLSTDEQCIVAMECVSLEFSAGETIQVENCVSGLGRGILVLKQGIASTLRLEKKKARDKFGLICAGMAYGADKVLLEDDNPGSSGTLHFLTFGKVVFIPRAAVLATLAKNDRAWTECAKWMYTRASLLEYAKQE